MICVSLSEKDFDACMKLAGRFELCEIRLDLCEFNEEQIKKLFSSHSKLVATFRPGTVPEETRKKLLKTAISSGATYVDIEFENDVKFNDELIEHARKHKCSSIISYHNYDETPSARMLEEIVEEGFKKGADVVKIATLSKSEQDNAALMSVYKTKRRLVVFGMGNLGLITRIAAPMLGAEFTFAAPDEKNITAPGQISIEKLEKIYKMMQ